MSGDAAVIIISAVLMCIFLIGGVILIRDSNEKER